jgi:hypothetical protein
MNKLQPLLEINNITEGGYGMIKVTPQIIQQYFSHLAFCKASVG